MQAILSSESPAMSHQTSLIKDSKTSSGITGNFPVVFASWDFNVEGLPEIIIAEEAMGCVEEAPKDEEHSSMSTSRGFCIIA